MKKISLKYIVNALFSRSDHDIEEPTALNVAYDTTFDSNQKVVEETYDSEMPSENINVINTEDNNILMKTDITEDKIMEHDTKTSDEAEDIPGNSYDNISNDNTFDTINQNNKSFNESSDNGSVLSNSKFTTLIDCCLDIMSFLDNASVEGDITGIKEQIRNSIFENFVIIGGEPIVNDTKFNAARHLPSTPIFIKPGALIEIVHPGITLEKKVLIKAIVKEKV